MPATRRTRTSSSSGPAAKGAQKTLSFGNKVSKPAAGLAYTKDEKDVVSAKAHPLSKTDTIDIEPSVQPESEVEAAVEEVVQAQAEPKISKTVKKDGGEAEARARAEKITDAQIKKYWRGCEAQRRTKQVHHEDVGVEEKILRLFDMSSQFGPAIGIPRTKRWSRAHKLKLNPPIEVLAVLVREEGRGNEKSQRAYVDELMSSKFTGTEGA
ncbi:hypothetical protein VTL71DRAFT_15209 [Oculimacula yallundae]|uniref:DNA polymerase delta subunit 4 n=1 Tax=Oculimacula yallundae TaxID=86028 RepID=A0ABR4CH76_9HELO